MDKNVLISKTDNYGTIIDVSQEYCNISQYPKEELIGQNHRIINHSDMPKETFKDLWKTISSGLIWNGEIKNRAKDGSFYWVDSMISPDYDLYGNIVGYTSIRHDITDKKKIEILSITDALTGLFNRRHFDTLFGQQIAIAKRNKENLFFSIMDIDHFKQYNDTYGHQEGGKTLKSVATALKNLFKRPDDYVFRLGGGEEFGVLYFSKPKENSLIHANIVREAVEKLSIIHSGNSASKYVTISMGIYTIVPENIKTEQDIYNLADKALYVAKENGRNRVAFSKQSQN